MKKSSVFGFVFVLFAASTASAAVYTYQCTDSQLGKTKIVVGNTQKSVLVTAENSPGDGAAGTLDSKYKPRNVKWAGCKKYDFDQGAFGADGSTSFLISKEMLVGQSFGFAQYRNTWDTYTTGTMPCNRK